MGIVDIKTNARRALHKALSVLAGYQSIDGQTNATITVRWHSKTMLAGMDASDGYAQMIDGLDAVVLDMDELDVLGITPKRGDRITMPVEYLSAVVVLEEAEQRVGPVTWKWRVGRL